MPHLLLLIAFLLPATGVLAQEYSTSLNPQLQNLATDFFTWRSKQQPVSRAEFTRVERPSDWLPAWSKENLAVYRARYQDYAEKLQALDTANFSRADEIDALLLSSAIKRVGWELDVLADPHRNPVFYVQQTLGSAFELLVLSSPWTDERVEQLLRRLNHFPVTIEQAKVNLNRAAQPLALIAIEQLLTVEDQLEAMQTALLPELPASHEQNLSAAVTTAADALADYRLWLQKNLSRMDEGFAIGPDAYQWFLSNIALLPYSASELLAQGELSWNRAVSFDALQQNRNIDSPELPLFGSASEQIAVADRNEQEIRAFLKNQQLLTIPYWLQRYRYQPMPAWLAPLSYLGVSSDLTSAGRLDQDAIRFIDEPSESLPWLELLAARDPRPAIIHTGVPGHYLQLALSWANPDPIRRHYFGSSANEGIAFYMEEMLLQAGLFDFSPRTREIIYRLMRLRALLVEVDIRMAIDDLTIAEAGEYLAAKIPMDKGSAVDTAAEIAMNPGHSSGFLAGKLQIEKFLADSREAAPDRFSLQAFHDSLLLNGNVPIALQRWEKLGLDDEIQRLKSLASQPATVPY
jgi:hypothetical protein